MRATPAIDTSDARERILDAAVEVLAQRGYSAAGVQEIVDLSCTSKGSFYFHFQSKEKMVMVLVDRMSEKLVNKIHDAIRRQPTPVHRVAGGIEVLMSTFARQRKVAQVLLLNIMGHGKAVDKKFLPMRDRFAGLIQQELDAAVAQGQIAPQDTVLLSRMWVGSLQEVVLRWLLTGQPNHLTDATPALRSALLRSIGIDPAAIQT
ncbi:MAG: TetR/AcrR family transcriptional regulator [Dehalococcoidia bacterium]|nr:TetR/AcrR family transcriptional regulator [Dehalococcoidia bacterium]